MGRDRENRGGATYGAAMQGFTLLELIVVLLIVGILLGAIGFSMGTRERELESEAERLAALMRLAQQETLLTAGETAVGFHAEGYRFYRRQGKEWLALTEGALRPRLLEPGFRMELRFTEEGDQVVPLPFADEKNDPASFPTIYFLSGGEITPFELRLTVESVEHPLTVQGTLQGEIRIAEWVQPENPLEPGRR